MAAVQQAHAIGAATFTATPTIGHVIVFICVTRNGGPFGPTNGIGGVDDPTFTQLVALNNISDSIYIGAKTCDSSRIVFESMAFYASKQYHVSIYELPGSISLAGVDVLTATSAYNTGQNPGTFPVTNVGDFLIEVITSIENIHYSGIPANYSFASGWTEDSEGMMPAQNPCWGIASRDGNGSSIATSYTFDNWYHGADHNAAGVVRFVASGTVDVDFVGTPRVGTSPLDVQFTDLSTNTPIAWTWDFGDGFSATEQNPLHTYQQAGIYTVSLTASNGGGVGVETKIDYVVVYEPSIMDLTNTICYNGYCFGFTFPAGGGPGSGSYIRRINTSEVEAVGYEDKRALQDGFDAADVFLGRRRIIIDAAIFGSSRGAMFDELAEMKTAFHPVDAFESDSTNLGFLPLDFYRPTADIVTWPTSAFPSGIPLRLYVRPRAPVREEYDRQKTGGIDEKGMAIVAVSELWARDPRTYLQSAQSIAITTSTQTATYRGDYESWPIVSFTMTAAGNSACQIVVSGGTVKIDLSGTTTGSYQVDYANRTITRTSDGTSFESLLSPSFTQDWRVVRTGSTFRISALTGMSSCTLDYREAFV